jgi:hypothetical protein
MNTRITMTFIVIGMATLTAAVTPPLITSASAQTTHSYCFYKKIPGTSGPDCSNTLAECQAARVQAPAQGWRVTTECFKFTNSVGHPDKFCFNVFGSHPQCYDSRQECQDYRRAFPVNFPGPFHGSYVTSECYRN